MTIKEIANKLAGDFYMSKVAMNELTEAVVEEIKDAIANGHTVKIHGFGKFSTKQVKAHTMVSPLTKKSIEIPARTKVTFRPSVALKRKVN